METIFAIDNVNSPCWSQFLCVRTASGEHKANSSFHQLTIQEEPLKVVVEVPRGASVRQKICTIDATRDLHNIDLVDPDRTLDP
jgi:hypothetical protein